ncbi:CLUMA_CG001993, isoform A [Clunio marinus]|uniref:CLUMA_CG001993, isoform A n=1 Tax=Clunio marinus TaxID=568069 RepID=A0A1J1HLC0_9DIPT|nr:CLUMA_CG001993, isoform A [Clunio marinus]
MNILLSNCCRKLIKVMGIFELQTFININAKDCIKYVSIMEEIDKFEKLKNGLRPILVFDVMPLVNLITKDNALDVLCGGRHQMHQKFFDDLFYRLSRKSELIFFLDGSVKESKIPTWSKRQNQKYEDHLDIINYVDQGVPLHVIESKHRSKLYVNILLNVIEASCRKYGQLYYAVHEECDQELARFAFKSNRVLAVLSNDSDFLIFPGSWRYFSLRDLNPRTLTTREFDRKAFRKALQLRQFQMPIFASLAGNDFVPLYDLQPLHKILFSNRKNKFPEISKYVRKNFKTLQSRSDVVKILKKLLSNNITNETFIKIFHSLESYNIIDEVENDNSHDHFLYDHNLFTYNILNDVSLVFSLVFYDLRQSHSPSYYNLSVPMFQRQAGILLQHHSSLSNSFLTIYTKKNHHSKYKKYLVEPTFPPFIVPSLRELYSDNIEVDDIRFDLLKWSIYWKRLEDFNFKLIPRQFLTDVLTIGFMIQERLITSMEADIFLWTIINVEWGSIPRNLKPPEKLHPKAFRLAFAYVKLFANIDRSIEICGLKKRFGVNILNL